MVSTSRFTWDPKRQILSAELSDFNGEQLLERVYPDAADVGVRVQSHVTGQQSVFVVAEEVRDRENELQYYRLKPTEESVRKVLAVKDIQILLYND